VRRRSKKAAAAVAALPMITGTIKIATIVKIYDLLSGISRPPIAT
jgi:hypothetical protein